MSTQNPHPSKGVYPIKGIKYQDHHKILMEFHQVLLQGISTMGICLELGSTFISLSMEKKLIDILFLVSFVSISNCKQADFILLVRTGEIICYWSNIDLLAERLSLKIIIQQRLGELPSISLAQKRMLTDFCHETLDVSCS